MNKSETIGALAAALSKLQGEVQNLHKDTQGYGYKYVELSSVLDAVRPLLLKYELAVSQLTVNDPSNPSVVGVESILMHSSGEWICSAMYMPVEPKKILSLAQCSGVVISYIRRYQLAAILGVAQTDNDASIKEPESRSEYVVAPLMCKLRNLIEDGELEDKLPVWCEYFKVKELDDLTESQIKKLITRIEETN